MVGSTSEVDHTPFGMCLWTGNTSWHQACLSFACKTAPSQVFFLSPILLHQTALSIVCIGILFLLFILILFQNLIPFWFSRVRFVFLTRISSHWFFYHVILFMSVFKSITGSSMSHHITATSKHLARVFMFTSSFSFIRINSPSCFLTFTWHWFSTLFSSHWAWRELSTRGAKCYLSQTDWQKARCL